MKKFLRNSFLWPSLMLVISCQKNNDTPTATMTFSINDTDATYGSYWVVVSDQAGRVLSWKGLPANVSTSLIYPAGKDPVNLTIIQKSNGSNNYTLTTYANVAPGSYSSPSPSPYQSPTILGTYKVQCPSPTDYQLIVNSESGSQSSNSTEYNVSVFANSSLFVSINKTGAPIPRYLYIPQISANGSVVIDQTLYNSLPEMKSKNVSLSESYAVYSVVGGKKSSNSNWSELSFFYSPNTNFPPIFYPDQIGSAFDEYQVFIELLKPYAASSYASTTNNLKDISNYALQLFTPTLDAVNTVTTLNLDYTLSGNAHYVTTSLNLNTNANNSWWYVHSPFSNKISMVLPIFPDDLRKEIDLSFTNTMKVDAISIEENELNGYTNFYENSILGQKKMVNNYKRKTYNSRPDGTIGGGG
jgi:hypothetical protein